MANWTNMNYRWPFKPSLAAGRLNFQHPLANGLQGLWLFNEGGGATVFDPVQKASGSVPSGLTWEVGIRGYQLSFPGTNNNWVTLPSRQLLASGSPVSIAFWQFVNAGDGGGSSFTIGNQITPNRCQAHCPFSDDGVYWDFGNNTGGGRVTGSYVGYYNAWTHVVLTSSGASNTFQGIYLNGKANASQNSSSFAGALTGGAIGAWPVNGTILKGKMASFSFYNRLLNPAEVLQLYADSYAMIQQPTTRRYFPVPATPAPSSGGSGAVGIGICIGLGF